ncbi:conjugal transfer protein TraM [Salmonella enterica subsp. enterica serovar Infantis]|uniref:conjugal transfer protein TraM n=1 Tax=Gammaproteobacteria TaxID=1236 RepID=UPI000B951CA8|nr:conjugal transfer protein TraM [Shigella sonnei]EBS0352138.1 conjugal transfer protein TraM [Salmonella enterica subsp. enterica serovar Java]EBW7170440.1 conjugal transfer protein TraM [Salmonella enterica subsp. enterica serovar Javiana]ECD7684198.1 conjugal transfer protein TraM [Salmonella enterica subsp. enterica serovar Typhimurium]ECH2216904.1 conjugal transfer protein TraM [Salmonella enterica]EDI0517756.1 conjugal transfer protein TraM [Salmonella enterica subsp. enterica serovar S
MLDFDDIRKEVAIRHNVLLGKDDPILVTVTVNELVLGRYLDLISDQYDEANRTLTLTLQQQVEQSKETAGKIITDAANYVSDQTRQAVAEAVKEAGKELRQQVAEVKTASREAVASGRDAQVAKNSATVAAVLAGVAALIAVAALVVVLVK